MTARPKPAQAQPDQGALAGILRAAAPRIDEQWQKYAEQHPGLLRPASWLADQAVGASLGASNATYSNAATVSR